MLQTALDHECATEGQGPCRHPVASAIFADTQQHASYCEEVKKPASYSDSLLSYGWSRCVLVPGALFDF